MSRYLVTGAAGFIGSHIAEELISRGDQVIGIDNFANGLKSNIEYLQKKSSANGNFQFIEMDIRSYEDCLKAINGVDVVFHQAALGSVPRSFKFPIDFLATNSTGFVNLLHAAMDAKVKKFIYASSSSVYGDDPTLPKREELTGRPLSPYALSKSHNEQYSSLFRERSPMQITGMRYFNVFGPRQKPDSIYAAVIPKWIFALQAGEDVEIYGDGETSRDFCYVKNVVQANILASQYGEPGPPVYNIACGQTTSLNALYSKIKQTLKKYKTIPESQPIYREFREGDIRHSLANISRAQEHLKYNPSILIDQGIEETVKWFVENHK